LARHKHKQRPSASPWPVVLIVGGVVLLGIAAYALWGNSASGPAAPIEVNGAPRLKVDREQVDLGDVTLGQWVEVSFQITNVGDQPLKFSEPPYVTLAAGC
jgi:hypothetical protein